MFKSYMGMYWNKGSYNVKNGLIHRLGSLYQVASKHLEGAMGGGEAFQWLGWGRGQKDISFCLDRVIQNIL